MVYEVTKNRVETLCKMIKRSQFSVNNSFHDRSSVPMQIVGNNSREGKYLEQLKDLCYRHRIVLSHEQVV
jgi:hypothetical protein